MPSSVRSVLLIVLVVALPAAAASHAAASCMLDERPLEVQVEAATAVFKGQVTGLRDDGVTARFRVEEVWKGPDLPAEVVVHGGPEQSGPFGTTTVTSVDRSWTAGATYLVFPRIEGSDLRDDSCSPTREWSAELAAARPADAHAPTGTAAGDPGADSGVSWWLVPAAALAAGGAGVVATVAWRRRRV